MLVVVRPAPDDRVQGVDQFLLCARPIGFHQVRDFGPEGCLIRPGGPLQQPLFSFSVLSEVPPEKIESVPDVRDPGLFRREGQAPLRHECFDQRLDLLFQELSRVSRDDEIVRVPDRVHLSSSEAPLMGGLERVNLLVRKTPERPSNA